MGMNLVKNKHGVPPGHVNPSVPFLFVSVSNTVAVSESVITAKVGGTLSVSISDNLTVSERITSSVISSQSSPGAFVQIGESLTDGPTWYAANRNLKFNWTNGGGDYLDALNIQNGATHYTTTLVSPANLTSSFSVGPIVQKMLDRENTGFYFSLPGFSPSDYDVIPKFERRDSLTPPTLHVVTDTGTFDCSCISNSWMSPSSTQSIGHGDAPDYMGLPCVLKFGIGAISGNVLSATLTVTWLTTRGVSWLIACNYLDMPRLITDPVAQLGGAIAGITNGLGSDTDLEGTVEFYSRMENNDDILAKWSIVHTNYSASGTDVCINPVFVTDGVWAPYGLTALRCTSQAVDPYYHLPSGDGMGPPMFRMDEYITHDGLTLGNTRYISSTHRSELYGRFSIMVDPDVETGLSDHGIKFPGFEGEGFSVRTEITEFSPANPGVTHLFVGLYGATNPFNTPGRAGSVVTNCCLQLGVKYDIEERVKVNTCYDTLRNDNGLGVVGVGSTQTSVVTSSIAMVGGATTVTANQFHPATGVDGQYPLVFKSDTITPALRGVGVSIASNTSGATPTFVIYGSILPIAPVAGDTFIACPDYDGPVYNTLADGALEILVNDVSVFSDTAFVHNNITPGTSGGSRANILWWTSIIFPGGDQTPYTPMHFEVGPTVIHTAHIGAMPVTLPLWLRTAAPAVNQWVEIPNSSFNALVAANPAWNDSSGVGAGIRGGGGVGAAWGAWHGKSIDTVHNKVWNFGGISGHAACGVNAALMFDLMLDQPIWVADCPSTVSADVTLDVLVSGNPTCTPYGDGKPRACQSYNGQQYDETRDRPMRVGSHAPFPHGSLGQLTGIAYDPVTHTNEALGTIPSHGNGASNALAGYDNIVVKHKTTGDLYVCKYEDISRWNCATNTFDSSFGTYTTTYGFHGVGDVSIFGNFAAVDHRRNRIFFLCSNTQTILVDTTTGVGIPYAGGLAGFPVMTGVTLPDIGLGPGGFFFEAADAADDCYLIMPAFGNQDVVRVNASTFVKDILPVTGAARPAWAGSSGCYTNFLQTGDLGGGVRGAVYYPNTGNAWFLRLPDLP